MRNIPPAEVQLLLNQIAQHNEQAFRKIYLHYQRQVFAFARMKLGDDAAAADIVQETFIAIQRNPLGYKGSCEFSTWLCSIAKNKVADWWRLRGRQGESVDLDDEQIQNIPDPNWDWTGMAEQEELHEILLECIQRLSDKLKESIYLAYFEDQRLETIALQQNCPTNTIKTRLFHARVKIRGCVENALGEGYRP